MKKSTMKTMAMLGGIGMAGYMYMKKNPEMKNNMKNMIKSMARKTYNKLDEME